MLNLLKKLFLKSVYCLTNIFVLAYRETDNIPLIALGLKETKEVDFSTPFKVQTTLFIQQ